MQFELAGSADDMEVRRLLRENTMKGEIQLTFEREPNSFLAASVEGDICDIVIARHGGSDRLVGLGSRAVMNAYVNGREARIGYLGQLRIDRTHGGTFRVLKRGFAKVRDLHEDGETPFYITTVVSDNHPARRVLEAGLEGLPRYEPIATLVTLTIPVTGRRRLTTGGVRRGDEECLDGIAKCLARNGRSHQFTPVWSCTDLLSSERTRGLRLRDFQLATRGGEVVGCLACWDQRDFKQIVIRGYGRRLTCAKPFINLASPLLGTPRLPPPGKELQMAFISHVAVDSSDSDVFLALLNAAYYDARQRRLDYLTLGFTVDNPLLDVVRKAYSCRQYRSIVYVVYWEDGEKAVRSLDRRQVHLEAAIL